MGKYEDEERRLYLWVRVAGSTLLLVTLVVVAVTVILLPAFNEDYDIDVGSVIAIVGTLATSALALVEVHLRLRRNGDD
jgi:hypothetical protein